MGSRVHRDVLFFGVAVGVVSLGAVLVELGHLPYGWAVVAGLIAFSSLQLEIHRQTRMLRETAEGALSNVLRKIPWLASLVKTQDSLLRLPHDWANKTILERWKEVDVIMEKGEVYIESGHAGVGADMDLIESATATIDAVSHINAEAEWKSRLGRNYWLSNLEGMKKATCRRIFVFANVHSVQAGLVEIMREQHEAGVEVRVAFENDFGNDVKILEDMLIVDRKIVSVSKPTAGRHVGGVTVHWHEDAVSERCRNFETIRKSSIRLMDLPVPAEGPAAASTLNDPRTEISDAWTGRPGG